MNKPKILALADYIEANPSDFYYGHVDTCIIGYCGKLYGSEMQHSHIPNSREVMKVLKLDGNMDNLFFFPLDPYGEHIRAEKVTARMAANALRNLVRTGIPSFEEDL